MRQRFPDSGTFHPCREAFVGASCPAHILGDLQWRLGRFLSEDLQHVVQPRFVMCQQKRDSFLEVCDVPLMGGQHLLDVEAGHLLQAGQEVLQGILSLLRMDADIRRDCLGERGLR